MAPYCDDPVPCRDEVEVLARCEEEGAVPYCCEDGCEDTVPQAPLGGSFSRLLGTVAVLLDLGGV